MSALDEYIKAAQGASLPKGTDEGLFGSIGDFGSSIANSSVGKMASGLGGFLLDTAGQALSPAYKENLIGQNKLIRQEELRKQGLEYSNNLYGNKATSTPYDQITQELNPGIGMNDQPGTGYAGGKMTIADYLTKQQSNPNKIIQTAASGMLRDRMQPGQASNKEVWKTMGVPGKPGMRTNAIYNRDTGSFDPKGEHWKAQAATDININPSKQYLKSSDVLYDQEGNRVPTSVGMTNQDARDQNLNYGKQMSDTAIQSEAAMGVSDRMLGELENVMAEGGDITGIPGFLTDLRSGADIWGVATNALLNSQNIPISEKKARASSLAKSIGNQLIQAMRGAAVGPQEQTMFEKQLPTAGQPAAVFKANLDLTRKNLDDLNRRKQSLSKGVKQKEQAILKDPADMTIEEIKAELAGG